MPERPILRRARGRAARTAAVAAVVAIALLGACSDDDDGGLGTDFDPEAASAQCEEFATGVEDPLVYLYADIDNLEAAAGGGEERAAQFEEIRANLSLLSEEDQRYVAWATCMTNLDPPNRFLCGPKDPEEDYLVANNEVCSPEDPSVDDVVVENPMPHGPFPLDEPTTTTEGTATTTTTAATSTTA